jgi:hypothetical protein
MGIDFGMIFKGLTMIADGIIIVYVAMKVKEYFIK